MFISHEKLGWDYKICIWKVTKTEELNLRFSFLFFFFFFFLLKTIGSTKNVNACSSAINFIIALAHFWQVLSWNSRDFYDLNSGWCSADYKLKRQHFFYMQTTIIDWQNGRINTVNTLLKNYFFGLNHNFRHG